MSRLFSSYHDDTGFLSNQLPRIQMPFIPQNLAEDQSIKTLVQPHERGTFFTKKRFHKKKVVKK